jgi:exosortase/archaeosortase family protein
MLAVVLCASVGFIVGLVLAFFIEPGEGRSLRLRGIRLPAVRMPGGASWSGIALVLVVAGAYQYSLFTLALGLSYQTPLAYLALVPIVAMLLGWVATARSARSPRAARELPLDFVLGRAAGLVLIFAAVCVGLILPARLGPVFWLDRLDLLVLPIFVGGLVALFYGLRRLWTVKAAILFLFLAWPVPYVLLLGGWLEAFTSFTAGIIRQISTILPLAHPASGDPTLFFIEHGATSTAVSIGSACSGVNGLAGFILIGLALMYVVRGRLAARLLWLSLGLVILWFLNIVRIEALFLAGATLGPDVAIDLLHPVAGLVTFNLGVVVMVLLVPRFGLRYAALPKRSAVAVPAPVVRPGRGSQRRVTVVTLSLGLALSLVAALANIGYARYESLGADPGGGPSTRVEIRDATLPGWSTALVEEIPTARQFFGADATWTRLLQSQTGPSVLRSSRPIYLDVIDTSDSASLAAYGVEDCYNFHGDRIEAQVSADMGGGVTAQVVTYFDPADRADWSAIWWEWPTTLGGQTMYERIVVFLPDSTDATFAGMDPHAPVAGDPSFHDAQQFLVTFARDLVGYQAPADAVARPGIGG